MLKVFYSRRAQSFMEYTMLIMIVAAALVAMTQYMQRSLNVRLKQVQEEISEPSRGE